MIPLYLAGSGKPNRNTYSGRLRAQPAGYKGAFSHDKFWQNGISQEIHNEDETSPVKMKLKSIPYSRRIGLIPMVTALALGWIFMGLWLATAIWLARYNFWWALTLAGSTLAFSGYLGLVTYNLIADSYRQYELDINDTEAVLAVTDRLRKKRSIQMVLLKDVEYAEYFPSPDSAVITLHAPYTHMEVPLWPLESAGADFVDYLEGRGVKVVNLQSDEKTDR